MPLHLLSGSRWSAQASTHPLHDLQSTGRDLPSQMQLSLSRKISSSPTCPTHTRHCHPSQWTHLQKAIWRSEQEAQLFTPRVSRLPGHTLSSGCKFGRDTGGGLAPGSKPTRAASRKQAPRQRGRPSTPGGRWPREAALEHTYSSPFFSVGSLAAPAREHLWEMRAASQRGASVSLRCRCNWPRPFQQSFHQQ